MQQPRGQSHERSMHEPQIIMETGSTRLLTHEGPGALAYKIRGMVPPAQ
jgi:hypothetical protein